MSKVRYKTITINGKRMLEHRYIWEQAHGKIPENLQIDHINGNKRDNRLENLQLVTSRYNTQRSELMRARGYKVVTWNKSRPYCASRTRKYFGTPCGAYMSYVTAYV